MTKFSKETRINVVMAIANGASIRGTARDYGVATDRARQWYRAYQSGGMEQVIGVKRQNFTQEFKVKAIEYLWQNELSYSQAAAELGIPASCTLYFWEKIFLKLGADGLQDAKKGRPPKVTQSKKPSKPEKPMNHEQQLEAENAHLRMENDYLKKLNALIAERKKSEKKTK